MKFLIISIVLAFSLTISGQTKITSQDLTKIIGSWEGSLTYLNYQSNEPYTMPANLVVEQGKNDNQLLLSNIYPNEPKANGSYKMKLTKNGQRLNKKEIILRTDLENGELQVQTAYKGKDDNRKALIRHTYLIGEDVYINIKEVQFEENGEWIKRNEFSYKRKK